MYPPSLMVVTLGHLMPKYTIYNPREQARVPKLQTFCKCINIVAEEQAIDNMRSALQSAFTIAVVVASGNAIFNSKTSCICAVAVDVAAADVAAAAAAATVAAASQYWL